MALKLGRQPNQGRPRITLTAELVPAAAYNPPPAVDYYSKVPASTWGMDGNGPDPGNPPQAPDGAGDCTFAEVDHTTKARQVAAGNPEVESTTSEILAMYSDVTGYDPKQTDSQGNNPTDQGAEMQAVRDYWRKTGAKLGGTTHKLLMFAEVEHQDHMLVQWCIDRFGALGVGINFPDTAMDQFNNGQPWDVAKHATIEGGHAIAAVGYDATYVYVVTWGKVQPMTWAFWDAYVEEAWADLDDSFVSSVSGNDPLGETLYALGQQFAAVTGKVNPVPAPSPQPSPQPTPAPAPAPAPRPITPPQDVIDLFGRILTRKGSPKEDVRAANEGLTWIGSLTSAS